MKYHDIYIYICIYIYILATASPGLRIHLALIEPSLSLMRGDPFLTSYMAPSQDSLRRSAEEQKYSANLDSCQVLRQDWALPGQLPGRGLRA